MKGSRFQWVLIGLLLGGCSSKSPRVSTKIAVSVDLYPAFAPSIHISVRNENGRPILLFVAMDRRDSIKIIARDSVQLSDKDWKQFIFRVDTSTLMLLNPILQRGMDGIGIRVKYSNGKFLHSFYSWSPDRQTDAAEYKIFDATFQLLNRDLPNEERIIEDVQNYFDYGLPVKLKSQDPFIARMYGDLSWGREKDLLNFFSLVPVDSGSIIDCSNFSGMGTLYFPYFKRFNRAHPRVIWIVNEYNKKHMKEAGVDTTRMVFELEDALARAKAR